MEKISVKPPADSIFNRSIVFSRAWKSTYQRSVNFLSAARVNTTCLAGLTHGRVLVWTRAGNENGKKRLRVTSSPRVELAVRLKERPSTGDRGIASLLIFHAGEGELAGGKTCSAWEKPQKKRSAQGGEFRGFRQPRRIQDVQSEWIRSGIHISAFVTNTVTQQLKPWDDWATGVPRAPLWGSYWHGMGSAAFFVLELSLWFAIHVYVKAADLRKYLRSKWKRQRCVFSRAYVNDKVSAAVN